MKSVLLGKKNKRHEYFSKACTDLNVDFEFFDIDEYFENIIPLILSERRCNNNFDGKCIIFCNNLNKILLKL